MLTKNQMIENKIEAFLDLVINNKKFNSSFSIKSHRKENTSHENLEIMQPIEEFNQRFKNGLNEILIWLNQYNPLYKEMILTKFRQVTFLEKTELEARMEHSIHLSEFFDLPDEVFHECTKAADSFFLNKNYAISADCFYFLCILNPYIYSLWLKYAYSEQVLNHLTSALHAYAIASLMNAEDPTPHYFSAQCYQKTRDISTAIEALDLATQARCEGENSRKIKELARQMQQKLKLEK